MSDTSGGTALKPLKERRQFLRIGGLGRNFDDLANGPLAVLAAIFAVPHPNRRGKVFQRNDHADEPIRLLGIVRWTQLEHHLLLGPEVQFLHMTALIQVPEVDLGAVLSRQQQLAG